MHEVALAGGILRVIDDAARREPFARVKRLTLQAGALSGVEVRALRFALDAIAPGTRLEGAEIIIHEPAASAYCMKCTHSVEIRSRTEPCPRCGSHQLQPTGGNELKVIDLIVDDDDAGPTGD